MCGRYTLRNPTGHPWLAQVPSDLVAPRYNIAPSQRVLVVGSKEEPERVVGAATWGFRPKWLSHDRRAPINARAETAATTPMFRSAYRQARCLVPADGWYEWQPRGEGPKLPYFFRRPDDQVFWFAGLAALNAEGQRTCAIITVGANTAAAEVHSRMPLVLPDDEAATAWLSPDTSADDLQALLAPAPAAAIDLYPVSRRVNKPTNDDPDCIEQIETE